MDLLDYTKVFSATNIKFQEIYPKNEKNNYDF